MKNVNFLAGKYKQQFRSRSFTPSLMTRPFRWSDPQIDVLLEAILPEEEIDPERRNDWLEVRSYTMAMNHAIEALQRLPLSMPLIKETRKILLSRVRGKNKQPGEIRRSQNWIGGSSIKKAIFIPPSHQEELPELLTDLEKFWHNESLALPHLVKVSFERLSV